MKTIIIGFAMRAVIRLVFCDSELPTLKSGLFTPFNHVTTKKVPIFMPQSFHLKQISFLIEDRFMSRTYANKTTAAIGEYFQSRTLKLRLKTVKTLKMFDSVCHDNSVQTPKVLDTLLGKLCGFEQDVFDSVVHGMNVYEKAHGCEAPADVIEQTLHNAVTSK